ncbi:hypothetical protein [Pseudogulbenkiania subflava]|uniref:Uncharacterized protein n=1 Tax=Pseudogulbenkiania subflava DSM 22618 TaxID=1123014 RepID=A0A1Y6BGR4_9NEIS|nr:hypothetical protein [Pseudogulbenkiania subflava]SMF10127.1 hypothetical protein SAMN02745746_01261 [Pseudogulbenkiania subflava DSM 22618]
MEHTTKEHDVWTLLRHILTHGLITLLAVAIAFATPDAARYILYVWWPRMELNPNVLLATEILLASILTVLFNLWKRAWDNHRRLASAKMASLVFTRHPRKSWLSALHERHLVRSLPVARDVCILSLTGHDTLIDPESLLKDVLSTAYEIRVMLLNPNSEAARKRVESLPGEVTLSTFQEEMTASIALLDECRKAGKKVSLKFYDHDPFWKLVVVDDCVWVQHCHAGRALKDQHEYVFGLQHADPGQGLFVPFYTYFLHKWNEVGHWEYDFDAGELVQRDAAGSETGRTPLGLPPAESLPLPAPLYRRLASAEILAG